MRFRGTGLDGDTFPPFLATNKKWFLGGLSYLAWQIINVFLTVVT